MRMLAVGWPTMEAAVGKAARKLLMSFFLETQRILEEGRCTTPVQALESANQSLKIYYVLRTGLTWTEGRFSTKRT